MQNLVLGPGGKQNNNVFQIPYILTASDALDVYYPFMVRGGRGRKAGEGGEGGFQHSLPPSIACPLPPKGAMAPSYPQALTRCLGATAA